MSGDHQWLVGISRPSQEAWAALNVERQGYTAYFPQYQEQYVTRQRKVAVRIRSLFPRYVFVQTDGAWRFLLGTFGMVGVVRGDDDEPAVVPAAEIERLRARENAFGYVMLPPKPRDDEFARGQTLRVTYGPMTGLTGVCLGDSARQRVKILLDFLGRKSSVALPRDALIAA